MSDLLHRLKHTDTDYTINEVVSYIETLQTEIEQWRQSKYADKKVLIDRIAELESENDELTKFRSFANQEYSKLEGKIKQIDNILRVGE